MHALEKCTSFESPLQEQVTVMKWGVQTRLSFNWDHINNAQNNDYDLFSLTLSGLFAQQWSALWVDWIIGTPRLFGSGKATNVGWIGWLNNKWVLLCYASKILLVLRSLVWFIYESLKLRKITNRPNVEGYIILRYFFFAEPSVIDRLKTFAAITFFLPRISQIVECAWIF